MGVATRNGDLRAIATAFPDDGGYSIWVAEAFGEFWGFQESYWSWFSGTVDNALYPVLAYQTAKHVVAGAFGKPIVEYEEESDDLPFAYAYAIKLGIVALFTIPNLFAQRLMGKGLAILAGLVILPFVVLVAYGIPHVDFSVLLQVRNTALSDGWSDLINILYWNFSGFDCISTCAGEVKNTQSSLFRGLMLSLILVIFTYLIPLSVAAAANDPEWKYWENGWFSVIATKQGGVWLGVWIVFASFLGNFGMYVAELFEDSWQLCGMADAGLAPSIFSKRHPTHGSPWVSIAFTTAIIATLVAFDFSTILVIDNFFSAASAMLEILAFLKHRKSEPNLVRPYRLPIESFFWLLVAFTIPIVLGSIIMVCSFAPSWVSVAINTGALLAGILLYYSMKHWGNTEYTYSRRNDCGSSAGI